MLLKLLLTKMLMYFYFIFHIKITFRYVANVIYLKTGNPVILSN